MKYIVEIDGVRYEVDVAEAPRKGTERRFTVNIAGREFEASVRKEPKTGAAPPVYTLDAGAMASAAPAPKEKNRETKPDEDASAVRIVAPMAGKIVAVNANPHSKVNRDDILFVLEAMKMENSIASTADGVIRSVHASVGDVVKKGDVLCVIVP